VGKQIDLLQGTLDMLILKAVSLGPLHGYGVLLRIQQISGEQLEIQQGSLYPALYRLEHQGLISSEWGESDVLPSPAVVIYSAHGHNPTGCGFVLVDRSGEQSRGFCSPSRPFKHADTQTASHSMTRLAQGPDSPERRIYSRLQNVFIVAGQQKADR